jgi:hypothetical protein
MRPRQSTSSKQPHRPTRKLRLHPRAELVPAMDERTYAGFRDHIAARGMRVPLEITAAGVVIDGQHRLRAAIELGLTRVPVRVIGPQEDTVECRGRSACLNGILVWLLGVERLAQRSLSA